MEEANAGEGDSRRQRRRRRRRWWWVESEYAVASVCPDDKSLTELGSYYTTIQFVKMNIVRNIAA